MASKQEKIKQRIEDYIRDSGIGQGGKLPPETALAQAFQVSRTTVRGAIQRLEGEGKLLVKHGSGTFITRPLPAIPSSLDRLYSIGDMIRSAGLKEDEQLESIKRLNSCPREIAERLEMGRHEPVVVLERTRTANGEAVAHSINYIPGQIAESIMVDGSFTGSLFQNFEYKAGVRIVGAYSEMTVPARTDPHARRLMTSQQAAVLLFKQLHYDELNRQVLYSYDYVRSDIFQFWIRRNR